MAVKVVDVEGLGPVKLQKRRGTRNLRLSISAQGEIRVSMPPWVPYKFGLDFVAKRREWIDKHRTRPVLLRQSQVIGKSHRLEFIISRTGRRASVRVIQNNIRVAHPSSLQLTDANVQQAAHRGVLKALQKEAEDLLPARLASIAKNYGFSYKGLRIKHLRTRWGSCDHQRQITLNCMLMTLPWELIDYVLLHELVHTIILRHGRPFWDEMAKHNPKVKQLRRQIREQRPGFSSLSA